MALDYQIVPLKGFGGGQDSYSAPSSIQPPYVSQLLNMDTQASGLAKTRKGYEGYYGYVPLRVSKIKHDGTAINFWVGSSSEVDFGSVASTPIVVQGKTTTAGSGDFGTSNNCVYYPSFSINNKFSFTSPSGTLSITADDTGLTSYNALVRVAAAGSGNSHTAILPDGITIDQTSFQVDIDYTTVSDEDVFVFWKQTDSASGTTYIKSVTSQTSVAVPASEHSLDTYNIQVECYDTTSGSSVKVIPDSVTISSAGAVTVTFTTAFTGDIYYNSVTNVASGTANAGSNTFTISNPTSPWIIASVYYYNSGDLVEVIPDDIRYDDASDTAYVDYTLAVDSETVEIYYQFGETIGNRIQVTDSTATSENFTDTEPQLTIWGIPHSESYQTEATAGGEVVHIDTYRRSGENRLVCGLGGNLFSAQTYSEAASSYCLPRLYTNLRGRVSGDTELSPLFHTTGSSSSRSRGIVTDDSISNNKARVTAATYVSSGVVNYTLDFDSKTGSVDTASTISTSDYLTVSGMANAQHNGTWKISSVVSDSSSQTVIQVANTSVWGSDLNETYADGRAGVFTDLITTTASISWLVGDTLESTALTTEELSVVAVSGAAVYVDGIDSDISLADGQSVFGNRTTDVVPLRDSALAASTSNLVRGDMLTVTDLKRKVRVKYVNPNSDINITDIDGDGTTATATTGTAHGLQAGQKVLIVGSGTSAYNGTHILASVPSTTTFTFASTSTATNATGTLVGETAELDESVTVRDSSSVPTTFTVVGRWIPVEIPTHSYDMPAATKTRPLDSYSYSTQPTLRSTTIADSMYLTSGFDEVYKFDGTDIYRAGLFRWQPQLFVQVDNTTGSILTDTTTMTISTSGVSNNRFKVTLGDELLVSSGDRVRDAQDGSFYTVVRTSNDGTNGYIFVATDILDTNTASRSLTRAANFNYYFRARAIDANNAVVASSVTGLSDFIVEIGSAAQIKMRLLGRPNFGPLDYDRIELDVYRTKANTAAPYYRVATLSDSFDAGSRYVDFVDGTPDETLTDLDEISTALLGTNVGVGWDQPLRAKYITSAGNKLITANLKDYPQIDLVLRKKASEAVLSASDLEGKIFTLRSDNTASGGTGFEFVTETNAVTLDPTTDFSVGASSFTVQSTGHGLSVGDWVYMYHSATGLKNHLDLAGWWQVASENTNDFTVTKASTFSSFSFADTAVTDDGGGDLEINYTAHGLSDGDIVRISTSDTLPTGLSASTDYYVVNSAADTFELAASSGGTPITFTDDGVGTHTVTKTLDDTANHVNRYVTATDTANVPVLLAADGNYNQLYANDSTTYELIAPQRLCNAINAHQSFSSSPFLTAAAGSLYGIGRVVLRQPEVSSTTPELVVPTLTSSDAFDVYVNNLQRTSGEQVSASTRLFPSRVSISYPNYPEINDNPQANDATTTGSAVDINAADGQEVTGVIPFFGEASFGSSQKEGMVVVTKTDDIYILNSDTRAYERVDQPYGGHTAPFALTHTESGVIFANKSGVYRLNRNMTVTWISKYADRIWKQELNKDQFSKVTAHNFKNGKQVKISYPSGTDQTDNNKVLVIDYSEPNERKDGVAISIYDNHPATGWAGLEDESFFATTDGQVFRVRNANDSTDYRDDASAFTQTLVTAPEDFDLPGVQKVVDALLLQLFNDSQDIQGVQVSTAMDNSTTFQSSDTLEGTDTSREESGYWFGIVDRRGKKIQVKVTNTTKDSLMAISGMAVRAAAITDKGTPQARSS